VVLGTTLAWPGTAVAAEPDGTESDAPPADPSASEPLPADTAKAKALYEKGKAAFDTTDYPAAIEAWTEAYSTLSDTPANAPVKAALIYNLATAQERAFGIDQDLTHLRRAEDLMEAYSRSIPALYGDGDEAQTEQSKIDQRLAQVRKTIEQAEAEARAEAERKAAEDAAQAGERDDSGGTTDAPPPDPKARIFIITGAALLGAGVAGLGVMGAGLALGNQADSDVPENLDDRRAQFDRGRAGNTMAYVGAGVGGAFVVAGAVLLGLGLHKRRATVSASLGPGQAGLLVRGRF
jgi:hypothetical protein